MKLKRHKHDIHFLNFHRKLFMTFYNMVNLHDQSKTLQRTVSARLPPSFRPSLICTLESTCEGNATNIMPSAQSPSPPKNVEVFHPLPCLEINVFRG